MTRTMGRYVAPPVLALWLAELALAFMVVVVMAVPGAWETLGGSWHPFNLRIVDHAALLAVTLGATAGVIGLYRPEICIDPRRVALHASIVALLAFPLALTIGAAFNTGRIGTYAIWLAKVLAVWVGAVLLSRWLFRRALSRALCPRKLAIVGSAEHAARIVRALQARRGMLFELARVIQPEAEPPSFEELRQAGVWAMIAPEPINGESSWLVDYRLRGMQVLNEASFCEQMLGRISIDRLRPEWFFDPHGFSADRLSLGLKRACDIIVSLLLLVITLPVMLLAALAVWLDSPGPILYRQERIGIRGRSFTLLKFRSMRVDAEPSGRPMWAAKRDPRITRVGAFIRSTRIDELPQLINVLRGDMSLVGPRPERPHFVAELARVIPFYNERSYVKPGITGWAQVNYPYGASVEDAREKLAYDLFYVRHWGLVLDLLILAATVRVILFREGAR